MNVNLSALLLRIKKLLASKEEVRTRPIARPVRDWKTILLCGVLALVCAIVFAGYAYYSSLEVGDSAVPAPASSAHPKITNGDIEKVLNVFDVRADAHANARNGGGVPADPSR